MTKKQLKKLFKRIDWDAHKRIKQLEVERALWKRRYVALYRELHRRIYELKEELKRGKG